MSTRRDGSAVRAERLRQIDKMIREDENVSLKRLIALIAYNIGLNEATAMRYLASLENLGFIEINMLNDTVKRVAKA